MRFLDFLSVGNITRDIIKTNLGQFTEIGGPSYYASKVCESFDVPSGVFTNLAKDFEISERLPNTKIFRNESQFTTTFINSYQKEVRVQELVNNASFLDFKKFNFLEASLTPKVVFYSPVFNEISDEFLSIFNKSKKICNLQGWLRRVGPNGKIKNDKLLPNLDFSIFDAIVLSELDIDQNEISRLINLSPLVCITKGEKGCVIINNQNEIKFDTLKTKVIDETGAGDIWAAMFGIQKFIFNSSLEKSAMSANIAASLSIESLGANSILTPSRLNKFLKKL